MDDILRFSLVVPVFNESPVILETHRRLKKVMDQIGNGYEIIYINDGSSDSSASILSDLVKRNRRVRLINFSRNFGHQKAISAGMDYASGEAVVIIDADLQDPPEVIPKMIEKWKEGYQVVYGKRKRREGESLFKRITAFVFYRILRSMTDINIPVDTGDFRLIDRKVCDVIKSLTEKNRFMRGLFSWIGFSQTEVEYVREERFAGKTKYPLRKMIHLAWDAVTSFSEKPLKMSTYVGFCLSLVSFLYLVVVIVPGIGDQHATPGWALIVVINLFFNGIILIFLGIFGKYLGRVHEETKNRPLYIVDTIEGFDSEKSNNKHS